MIDVVSEHKSWWTVCGWSRRLIQHCAGAAGTQQEKDYWRTTCYASPLRAVAAWIQQKRTHSGENKKATVKLSLTGSLRDRLHYIARTLRSSEKWAAWKIVTWFSTRFQNCYLNDAYSTKQIFSSESHHIHFLSFKNIKNEAKTIQPKDSSQIQDIQTWRKSTANNPNLKTFVSKYETMKPGRKAVDVLFIVKCKFCW